MLLNDRGEAALNVGCYHTVHDSRLYDDDLLVFYPLKENLGDLKSRLSRMNPGGK